MRTSGFADFCLFIQVERRTEEIVRKLIADLISVFFFRLSMVRLAGLAKTIRRLEAARPDAVSRIKRSQSCHHLSPFIAGPLYMLKIFPDCPRLDWPSSPLTSLTNNNIQIIISTTIWVNMVHIMGDKERDPISIGILCRLCKWCLNEDG